MKIPYAATISLPKLATQGGCVAVPKYDDLFNPFLQAMHKLGGSASVSEQEDEVAAILKLSDRDVAEIHRGSRTKLSYRLAWVRT